MLTGGFFRKIADSKGQSLVEIGLITPLLLVALWIPADFGIAFLTAHLTQNAVREAARIAVSTKDDFDDADATAIKTVALNRLPVRLQSPTVTVKYYGDGTANCMSFVEVVATGTYQYTLYQLIRLFGGTVNNTTPISRTTRMRYEFQPYTNSTACSTVSAEA
jgi:Flp pilus assembly protein TadG